MKKVICIKEITSRQLAVVGRPEPFVGEVCEVIEDWHGSAWVLGGRFDPDSAFRKECFAKVSSIDETTFERNYKTETV